MGFAGPPAAAKPCRAARRDAGPVFTTAQTVVIGTPEQMAASAAALWEKGATLLKIKLDARLISERMVAIRSAVPEATPLWTPMNRGVRRGWRRVASYWRI